MAQFFKQFLSKESGAVTTEFIVLVAAVVGLGVVGLAGSNSEAEEVVNTDPNVALESFVAGF